MKKILITFLLIYSLFAKAQKDTARIQFSDSTAIGLPDGKSTSKQIGTTGGTIVSEDGRVELIFPSGALTANTTIGIQPTTNLAPNGVGKSYWFEPSGILFKKPVRIVFNYTDEEAEICPPDWMSLGIQGKSGKWSFVDYESFDSVAKTLKGYIQHFSGASNVNDIMLAPLKHQIPVNGKTQIDVIDITRAAQDPSFSPSGRDPAAIDTNNPVLWYANGILDGNNLTGKISAQTAHMGKQKVIVAEYEAPSIMPKENPVIILAEVYRKTRTGKVLKKRLSTSILVYDMYNISVIYKKPGSPAITDSASFVATIYPNRADITEIINYPPVATLDAPPQCEAKIILDESCVGILHIAAGDVGKYSMSKDSPPEILLEFREKQNLVCKFQYICKKFSSPINNLFIPSEPHDINFIANGQRQTINYSPNPYTIIVNRVRRE